MTMNGIFSSQDQLYALHHDALVCHAMRIVGLREVAEDIVQDAFLQLATREPEALTASYIFAIVRNLSIDRLRRRRLEQRVIEADLPFWARPMGVHSAESGMLAQESRQKIVAAVANLPSDWQRALKLHRFSGQTYAEIGQQMGISTATAHRYVRNALINLSPILCDSFQEDKE